MLRDKLRSFCYLSSVYFYLHDTFLNFTYFLFVQSHNYSAWKSWKIDICSSYTLLSIPKIYFPNNHLQLDGTKLHYQSQIYQLFEQSFAQISSNRKILSPEYSLFEISKYPNIDLVRIILESGSPRGSVHVLGDCVDPDSSPIPGR